MANFDMMPPDPNELFGFNGPLESTPKWEVKWLVIGGFVVMVCIAFYQRRRLVELKEIILKDRYVEV